MNKKSIHFLFMSLNYIYDTFGIYKACTWLQWISHPSENEEYIKGECTAVFRSLVPPNDLWSLKRRKTSQGQARGHTDAL